MFMDPKGELGLSKLAYHFLGGVIKNVDALDLLLQSDP